MAHPHSPADAAEGNSSPDDNSSGPRLGRKNRANAGEAPAQTPPGPKKSPRNGRRPHRKGRPHRRTTTSSRCLTALAALTLLLTACRIDAKFEFKEDGSAHTEIIVEDNTGSMQKLDSTCDEFKTLAAATNKFLVKTKAEDITPQGGRLKCRIKSNITPDRIKISKDNKLFTVELKSSEIKGEEYKTISATTIITMPGKVIKSDIGKTNGNKVVIKGVSYIFEGFKITSEKGGSANISRSSSAETGTPRASGTETASDFPLWIWICIGFGGAIGLLLGSMLALRARKRKRRCNGSYYDPRRYLDHTRQTGSHPPYGS